MAQEGGVQGMSAKAGLKSPLNTMKYNKYLITTPPYAPFCAPNMHCDHIYLN